MRNRTNRLLFASISVNIVSIAVNIGLLVYIMTSGSYAQHRAPLVETASSTNQTVPTQSPSVSPLPSTPAPIISATPLSDRFPLQEVQQYVAYRVKAGDTLESISKQGGSNPKWIEHYNRLNNPPQPGRELIIPQFRGKESTLPDAPIMVLKGNTSKPWVALTIDCGVMDDTTRNILDTLRNARARATFFIHGDSIAGAPDILQRIVREGHDVGNHSFSHPDFTTLSDDEIAEQLRKTEERFHAIVGPEVPIRPYFRFPFGASNERTILAVVRNGYLPIHWTIDPGDTKEQSGSAINKSGAIIKALPPEQLSASIVLMHCLPDTAQVLPEVLSTVEQRGLTFHTLTEVLGP